MHGIFACCSISAIKCPKLPLTIFRPVSEWKVLKRSWQSSHPVLEKVGVEVLVEAVSELGPSLLPDDLVGERDLGVQVELHSGLRGQVDVDDLEIVRSMNVQ